MANTQRTVEEASKYILDSIEGWKSKGQDKKIISLSNWAERWNSKNGGHVTKMREILKTIRGLELIIKRNKKINPNTDSTVLEGELERVRKVYAKKVDLYGDLKPKVKKNKIELPKREEDTNSRPQ
jgi:hypothetical protein